MGHHHRDDRGAPGLEAGVTGAVAASSTKHLSGAIWSLIPVDQGWRAANLVVAVTAAVVTILSPPRRGAGAARTT